MYHFECTDESSLKLNQIVNTVDGSCCSLLTVLVHNCAGRDAFIFIFRFKHLNTVFTLVFFID